MISLDSTLKGDVLMLRESMIKFEAPDSSSIEICGSGIQPLACFLNRQMIKILEDLGVPKASFMDLQQEEIDLLRSVGESPLDAAEFLEKVNIAKSVRLPWLLKKLSALGLDYFNDNFLRRAVELAVLIKLRELKYRSRILVKHGYTLYGIMDETGILKEGEVYCPTWNQDGRRTVLIQRDVVITRSPALHPGDVQIVNAVDVPADSPLGCIHNCIVFSQDGVRDLPSKLSGGDLDGDLYNILYDPRLIPKQTHIPADYPRARELLLSQPVTKNDIIDFFLIFMQQDQLGRIATIHQVIADQEPLGTKHRNCLLLAELHSTAVDFSKSGRPVCNIPTPLELIELGH